MQTSLGPVTIHKRNDRPQPPLVSLILLDWSCRERFHALDWLQKQTVPREQYEVMWVELFDRVVPQVIQGADVVITCGQKGSYHKHKGYNIGLLQSRGQVITVCDSDAVFPPNFIESIIKSFQVGKGNADPLVLMHYEWRTNSEYPDHLTRIDEVSSFQWQELWPNVGACVSVRRADAIRFGGFAEHSSYRGFVCGPYDLGWRLVNAGLPEVWHDSSVALWHFAHPAPYFRPLEFSFRNLRRFFEVSYPHCEYHALTAVEAFSTGRMLPLQENPEVYGLRMSLRRIGTPFEEKYATRTGAQGFSRFQRLLLRFALVREGLMRCSGLPIWLVHKTFGPRASERIYRALCWSRKLAVNVLQKSIGRARFEMLKKRMS